MEKSQINTTIVLVVLILCIAGICCVSIIVFGTPFANKLAGSYFKSDKDNGLVLKFNGSLDGVDGEQAYENGLSFTAGHTGKGVLFDNEDTLYYHTEKNINHKKGSIGFWVKPLWDGSDEQEYVFFEVGDDWFNRFRIMKDGANNLRFMVWSSKVEHDAACRVDSWVADDWHHIQATWVADSISLYTDGELCDTQTFVIMPERLSPQMYIGSSANGDLQAQSVIDDFIISSKP